MSLPLTHSLLIIFILLATGWAVYDVIILDLLRGKTQLKVPLLRRSPIDSAIFVLLTAILLYQNSLRHGPQLTAWLLGGLALLAIWLGWFRQPMLRFKTTGFFYAGLWVDYSRIRKMNLSEDGVLLITLEKRQLYIRVRNIDDLESIYQFLVSLPQA